MPCSETDVGVIYIHVLLSYGCNLNSFVIIVDSEEGVYAENSDFVLQTV